MGFRRVRVAPQPDDQTCAWRTCFNALILIKKEYELPDERNLVTYTELDIREFRVRAIQRIIIAVQERAQEEIDRAEEFARAAAERDRVRAERRHRDILAHQEAIRLHEQLSAEVEEWARNRAGVDLEEAVQAERVVEDDETRRIMNAWEEMERHSQARQTQQTQARRARRNQQTRGRHNSRP